MGRDKIRYEVPQENPDVGFYTVSPQNRNGSNYEQTVVGEVYFDWDYPSPTGEGGGFTNTGWWGIDGINYGPTHAYGFETEDAVKEYAENNRNLNLVFAAWQAKIDSMSTTAGMQEVLDFANNLKSRANYNNCVIE